MPRKIADRWFAEYGESHQHHANELIHWICVPLIFFSGQRTIPTGGNALAVGMLGFMTVCQTIHLRLEMDAPWPVWKICLAVFILAWIGQFIGHKIEGKKPSFFKDVVFLLIGPVWLLSMVYKKVGLKY